MDLKQLNKPVDINHIDFRIQSISKKGWATILAYKNARYDMNVLDEVCGAENWQRDHKELKGNIYAGIGIFCTDKWVWKWDAGAESYSDKEKGEASDSFKRAGFNWGIGRELYDFPLILLELKSNEFTLIKDKAKQTFDLKLKQWKWIIERKDNIISKLTATDESGQLRYDSSKYVSIKNPANRKEQKKTDDKSNSNELVKALGELTNCTTISQMQKCWTKYKQYQTHETFILTKDNLKKKLS